MPGLTAASRCAYTSDCCLPAVNCCVLRNGTPAARCTNRLVLQQGETCARNLDGSPGTSGDPILSGFDGKKFVFEGLPYSYFSLIQEQDHSVVAYFTPASLFDHNGTYITAIGFQYDIHQVAVRVEGNGSLSVDLNGLPVVMRDEEDEIMLRLENFAAPEKDNLTVDWELYRPSFGNIVTLKSPLLTLSIWSVAPGSLDDGGLEQPAYLNTQFALHRAPVHNHMDGILGRTYDRLVNDILTGHVQGSAALQDMPKVTVDEVAYLQTAGLFHQTRQPSAQALHRERHTPDSRRMALDTTDRQFRFPVSAKVVAGVSK